MRKNIFAVLLLIAFSFTASAQKYGVSGFNCQVKKKVTNFQCADCPTGVTSMWLNGIEVIRPGQGNDYLQAPVFLSKAKGGSVVLTGNGGTSSEFKKPQGMSFSDINEQICDCNKAVLAGEDPDEDPLNEIQVITSEDGSATITPSGIDYDISINFPECLDCDPANENVESVSITDEDGDGVYDVVITNADGTTAETTFEVTPSSFVPEYTEGTLIGTHTSGTGDDTPIYIPNPTEIDCEILEPCILPIAEDDYFEDPLTVGEEMCFDVLANDNHPLSTQTFSICGDLTTEDTGITTSVVGTTICITVDEFTEAPISVGYTICDEDGQESTGTLYGEVPPPVAYATHEWDELDTQNGTVETLTQIYTKSPGDVPIPCGEPYRFEVFLEDGTLWETITGTLCGSDYVSDRTDGTSILDFGFSGDFGNGLTFGFNKRDWANGTGNSGVAAQSLTTKIYVGGQGSAACPDESENPDNFSEICAVFHYGFDNDAWQDGTITPLPNATFMENPANPVGQWGSLIEATSNQANNILFPLIGGSIPAQCGGLFRPFDNATPQDWVLCEATISGFLNQVNAPIDNSASIGNLFNATELIDGLIDSGLLVDSPQQFTIIAPETVTGGDVCDTPQAANIITLCTDRQQPEFLRFCNTTTGSEYYYKVGKLWGLNY